MTDLLDHGVRKARKAHQCDNCCKAIEPGETYFFEVQADGGDLGTYKSHEDCNIAVLTVWEELPYDLQYLDGMARVIDMDDEDLETVKIKEPAVYARMKDRGII